MRVTAKSGRRGGSRTAATDTAGAIAAFHAWFASRDWQAFPFQEEVWRALAGGTSGVLHAPTGTGKTLAAWLGAIARSQALDAAAPTETAAVPGPRVVWVTPLRALAADTVRSLTEPLRGLRPLSAGWTVG
ncbi:MAG: DEAD/DEAH box helicase, partial [Planctomycetia bacterium]|nr:DEAD/DEAH box helicase [Planctomycetia bacterium]